MNYSIVDFFHGGQKKCDALGDPENPLVFHT